MYLFQYTPYHPVAHKFVYGKGVCCKGVLGRVLDVVQFHTATVDTEPATLQEQDKGLWRAGNYFPPAGQFRLPLQLQYWSVPFFFGLVRADD